LKCRSLSRRSISPTRLVLPVLFRVHCLLPLPPVLLGNSQTVMRPRPAHMSCQIRPSRLPHRNTVPPPSPTLHVKVPPSTRTLLPCLYGYAPLALLLFLCPSVFVSGEMPQSSKRVAPSPHPHPTMRLPCPKTPLQSQPDNSSSYPFSLVHNPSVRDLSTVPPCANQILHSPSPRVNSPRSNGLLGKEGTQ
jgi:hypothetical protein